MENHVIFIILLIFIFLLELNKASEQITCRDENGVSVDWYYLYKLPNTLHKSDGLKYLYLSSNSYENGWQLSNLLINDTKSFPGATLLASSIFNTTTTTITSANTNENEEILSMAYNDEVPNGKVNFILGHTKGVLVANSKTGFWLIHSVPKYPNLNLNYYTYPNTGKLYGQNFVCITFNSTQIIEIGKQLIYNEPNVYYYYITENLKNFYSIYDNIKMKKWIENPPYWNVNNLYSLNGITFKIFSKTKLFNKELYEDWLAPMLNTNLFVETWRNGPGNLPSNCTRTKHVLNISEIKFDTIKYSFNSTKDHSKWCVATKQNNINSDQQQQNLNNKNSTENNNNDWICVGDINRQQHQLKRAGGIVCQLNSIIAKSYRDLIENYESC